MTSVLQRLRRSASTVERLLWWNWGGRPGVWRRLVRIVTNVVDGAFSDHIYVRAGFMTYLSLFHLVPMGALALALASRLGWRDSLAPWIMGRLSPTAPELAANLVSAMERLDLWAVGVVGLGIVLIASVFGISELEESLSRIWHAPGPRAWWQRLIFYPLPIILAPSVLAVTLVLGTIAEARTTEWISAFSQWGSFSEWLYHLLLNLPFLFRLVPYVVTWFGLTIFYYLISSAPIRFRAAAVGGITAGIIWQLAQQAYISFQFGFHTYREIWGYLAQIPLLILWVYLSWIIFYIGAQVVFAWQYRNAFLPKWSGLLTRSIALEENAVGTVLTAAQNAAQTGTPEIDMQALSSEELMPWPLVEFAARRMARIGILNQRRTPAGYLYSLHDSARGQSLDDILRSYRQFLRAHGDVKDQAEMAAPDTNGVLPTDADDSQSGKS